MDVGLIKGYTHEVKLNNYQPIACKQYPIPISQRGALAKKLDEYIKAGIIEPGQGPWNSPLIVRDKKDGTIRLVLDAKGINERTEHVDYPMNDIRSILSRLGGFSYFSTIDMESGYHQVVLEEKSQPLFGFRTPWGKFQFRRLPMRATNSGTYFQKVVEEVLADVGGDNVIVFQDDILVTTKSIEQHLSVLGILFKIFMDTGITIKAKKCKLLRKEVKFLGHLICKDQIRPDPENINCIKELALPRTKKMVRSLLGRINFYSRFIKGMAEVVAPLQMLVRGKRKDIVWDQEAEESFVKVKEILTSDPVLICPDYSRPFRLCVSHGKNSISAVLEQEKDNGVWPVGYYSRRLKEAELNYPTIEKEAMAIVDGLEHFRHIVHGYLIQIFSNQCSLEYLRGLREGNSRISRWIVRMLRNSPEFVKRGADSNIMSDLLVCNDQCVNELDDEHKSVVVDELMEMREPMIDCPVFYTDGSCSKNGKENARAGIGVFSEHAGGISISERVIGRQTNNRAEILAVIRAIEMAIKLKLAKVKIVTDSNYVVENILKNLDDWMKNKGLNQRDKPITNIEEYKEIYELLKTIEVEWEIVKGHTKVFGNEEANKLAIDGASIMTEEISDSVGLKREPESESGVKSNLELDNKRKCMIETVEVSTMSIRTQEMETPEFFTIEKLLKMQSEDPEIIKIEKEIDMAVTCSWDSRGIRLYKNVNGLIYARGKIDLGGKRSEQIDSIYAPKVIRNTIMRSIHNSKWSIHPQHGQLCIAILKDYFWATFRSDVRRFLKTCMACQKTRETRTRVPVLTFERPTKPWDMVSIDIVGPLYRTADNNEYILSIIDLFTRYITLIPLPDQRTSSVLWAIEKYYLTRFGVPGIILSDNASNFCSDLFNEICRVIKTEHKVITPWHPQCNGTIERANRELKKYLTHLCERTSETWDKKIHYVEFVLNNTVHSATGHSPSEMLYGNTMRSPDTAGYSEARLTELDLNDYLVGFKSRVDTIRKMAGDNDGLTQNERNKRINRNRKLIGYELGQEVLYRRVRRGGCRNNGFTYRYEGPYCIIAKISDVTYRIKDSRLDSGRIITTHADRIKGIVREKPDKDKVAISDKGDVEPAGSDAGTIVLEPSGEVGDIGAEITQIRHELSPITQGDNLETVGEECNPQVPTAELPNHKYMTRSKGVIGKVDYSSMKFDKAGRISVTK